MVKRHTFNKLLNMKKYSYLLFICILMTLTSCLKSGLEDLPEFEGNSILAVRKVEYRYDGKNSSGVSGEAYMERLALTHTVELLDKESKQLKIKVTVPASNDVFTAADREKCSAKEIAIMLSIETAARITPVGDAPALGIPGDWTKPNKYIITAANGDKAEWTITVTEFNK